MIKTSTAIVVGEPVILVAIAILLFLRCLLSSDLILLDALATSVASKGLLEDRFAIWNIVAIAMCLLELHCLGRRHQSAKE